MGKYQHKVVLISSLASCFRNRDTDSILSHLKKRDVEFHLNPKDTTAYYRAPSNKVTADDFVFAYQLHKKLSSMEDYSLRVESPWISLYCNSKKDVDAIIRFDSDRVKYYSSPDENLEVGTIIMPKVSFDYRVTMGKSNQPQLAFIEWADNTSKIKMTKSCRRDLQKSRSWGGTYFYITGDNMLLMAKMHLGGSITKIERIIRPEAEIKQQ
jgi:hypothetical protein